MTNRSAVAMTGRMPEPRLGFEGGPASVPPCFPTPLGWSPHLGRWRREGDIAPEGVGGAAHDVVVHVVDEPVLFALR